MKAVSGTCVVDIGDSDNNQLIEAQTYYAPGAYTLSGTVTEAHAMGTVKITHNDGINSPTTTELTPNASNIWTYNGVATTGTHQYTLELKDAANNIKQYTYSVIYDNTSPSTTFNTINAYTKNDTVIFSGTVTEANLLSAELAIYTGATPAESDYELVNVSSSNGSWSYTKTSLTDDTYKVALRMKDKAGHEALGIPVSPNYSQFTVDMHAPAMTFASTNTKNESFADVSSLTSGNTYYCSDTNGYGIVATITDNNFDADNSTLRIDTGTNTGTATPLSSVAEYDSSNKTWTVSRVTASNTYVFTLVDLAGNSSTHTVQIRHDTTGPTVEIKNPGADITNGNAALDGTSFSFKINADDGSGVGIKTLKYKFIKSTEENAAEPVTNKNATAGWTVNDNAIGGDTFVDMNLLSGTTANLAENKLCEGVWYLHVIAIDKAGNISNNGSSLIREFIVDKAAPVTTLTTTKLDTSTNEEISVDLTDSRNDPWYFKANTLTIGGTITETNGLADTGTVVITKTVGSTTTDITTINKNAITNGTWSYGITTGESGNIANDTMTLITVVVKDVVGRESKEYKINVYKDTTPPEIDITSILEGDAFAKETLNDVGGTVIDGGSGVASVSYVLKRGDVTIADGNAAGTTDDLVLSGSRVNISTLPLRKQTGGTDQNPEYTGEGTLTLTVTATDKAANTGTKTITFSYDLYKPTFMETTGGASGKTTNADVTFGGLALDTNEFKRIEFVDSYTSTAANASATEINFAPDEDDENYNAAFDKTLIYPNAEVENTSGGEVVNWSQTFAVGTGEAQLADGEHIFTITGYDTAGKSTQVQRTVIIDRGLPTLGTPSSANTVQSATIGGKKWYGSASIPLEVTATDNEGGTGIAKVEYSKDYNSSTQTGSWTSMIIDSGTKYTGTVNCSAGKNTLYVKATDNAGNSVMSSAMDIYIDVGAPASATLDGSVSIILTNGININGVGNDTYNAVITAIDSGAGNDAVEGTHYTGIDSVNFVKIGNTPLGDDARVGTYNSTTGKWTVEIPASAVTDDGSATFEVKDKVGNTATFSLFQLQRDMTYPKAEVNSIHDADTDTADVTEVNGSITVNGTASDTYSLADVKLQYQTSTDGTNWSGTEGANTGAAYWTTYTTTTNTTGSLNNWSYTINTTTAFTDNTYVRFRAVATDQAGNVGNSGGTDETDPGDGAYNEAYYKTVLVKQYTDRPVIRFTNLDLSTPTVWLKNDNVIRGLISDDDGDVTSFKYKYSGDTDWTALTPVSGSGYFEITGIADGESTIYFQATDAARKTFATDTAQTPTTLNEPILYSSKVVHNTTTNEDETQVTKKDTGTVELTLKVDKLNPVVDSIQYQIYNTEQGQWGNWVTNNDVKTWTADAWASSLVTLGGRYTKLRVKLEASDQNSIASVTSYS